MRLSLVVVLLVTISVPLFAADPFYLGTWKVTAAAVAPWADPNYKLGDAEMKSLIGKVMVVKANEITGPQQLACKGPRYRLKDYPADMLFQGAFGELQRRDKSIDPLKVAAKLGFHGTSWKTLETGCGNELDFHFVDPATAEFGLNDYVYTLKKQ